MRFAKYKALFLAEKAALGLNVPGQFTLEGTVNPASPPWRLDWFLSFDQGMYLRTVEYFRPKPSPDVYQGYREHFSFQYGFATGYDPRRGAPWPWTSGNDKTVIRIDKDRRCGPHLLFRGRNHIPQADLTGTLILETVTIRQFVEAVKGYRSKDAIEFESSLGFRIKRQDS